MSMAYVRRYYKVPAKRGATVVICDRPGVIMSATNYLHVRFTDGKKPRYGYAHPTYRVIYQQD